MSVEEIAAVDQPERPDTSLQQQEAVLTRRRRHKRRVVIFLVVSLVNLGLLSLLASQILTPAQGGLSANGGSPLLGKPAPDFMLPLLNAGPPSTLHLAALRGKPVILNFWASWCDACKEEAPLLEKTWQHISGAGALLIGINAQDTHDAALHFMNYYGITYPNVVDTINGATTISYGVTGFPETFFIDRHGSIIRKEIGVLSARMVQQDLQQLGVAISAEVSPPLSSATIFLIQEVRDHEVLPGKERRR